MSPSTLFPADNGLKFQTFQRYDRCLRGLILDRQAWFPARDLARLTNSDVSGRTTRKLDPDQYRWERLVGSREDELLVSESGLYTLLLRVGPNTRIEAHAHPDDRVATVISGTWYFGYGAKFDEKALKTLPPGSFYTEPPHMNHFAMTRGDGVTIQITGTGPSGTTYVDPANDPARKK